MKVVLALVGVISAYTGLWGRKILAYMFASLMMLLDKDRKKHTIHNIQSAFPDKPKTQVLTIARDSYRNLAITFLEIAAMPYMSLHKISTLIYFTNITLIKELAARDKGLILLSGHFGNWELLAFSAGYLSGVPMSIIIKKQRNKAVADLLQKIRTRHHNSVIDMESAAKSIIRDILLKRPVALLADQAADPNKDVFVNFFGRPAVTYEAPAQLSLKFGVPIIIGFAVREKNGRYRVTLQEVKTDDLNDTKEDRLELTKRHVAILEETIKDFPEQWAWQHKRWKYGLPE